MAKSELCSDIIWAVAFLWSYNTLISLQEDKMNENIRSLPLKLFWASGLENHPGKKIALLMMNNNKYSVATGTEKFNWETMKHTCTGWCDTGV